MQMEEALLHSLYRDLEVAGKQLEALREEYARVEETARTESTCEGSALAALSRYRISCMKKSANLTMRVQQIEASIEKQKIVLRNARRDHELLTKLEDRQYKQWEAEVNRVVEAEASEAFLQRWNRK